MKHIAYLGPAFSGKTASLLSIGRAACAPLEQRPPFISLAMTTAHGPVIVAAVPGLVFDGATPRREIVTRADCIVFVADSRPDRLDATIEMWETLSAILAPTGRNPPVILQYNHRDAPGALPVAALEEALGIQPFLVAGDLRMPNVTAAVYPHRFESIAVEDGAGVREAYEAAVQAAHFGLPKPSAASAELAMAMLDRQIADRLAGALPGRDDAAALAKAALKSDEGKQAYIAASKDALMDALYKRLEDDPAFLEQIAQTLEEEAPVLYEVTCVACKAVEETLTISFHAPGSVGPFTVGGDLPVSFEDVDKRAYTATRDPEGEQLLVLECSQCTKCEALSWFGLVIERGKLVSIWPVSLTRTTLERSHLVSAGVAVVAAQLASLPIESLTPQTTFQILRTKLPP